MTSRKPKPLTVLGAQVRKPIKRLETFAAPPDVTRVLLRSEEFTSLCPVTGQPDFSTVTIEYVPRALCLESKSLKLYLWTYREEGVFCEALAARIWDDLARALDPQLLSVTVTQRPRGGISIEATAKNF